MSKLERELKKSVYFKLLNPVQQQTALGRINKKHLRTAIAKVKKIGFEKWLENNHYSDQNRNIIQSLNFKNNQHATV